MYRANNRKTQLIARALNALVAASAIAVLATVAGPAPAQADPTPTPTPHETKAPPPPPPTTTLPWWRRGQDWGCRFCGQNGQNVDPKTINQLVAAGDPALLQAVNDARLHPEKYPPHGNATGAKTTACTAPFTESGALEGTASAHNTYIGGQPASWITQGENAHENADGKLSWDSGGPIAGAGYNSQRGEIVAWGYPNEAAAVVGWMQDDAHAAWGHRNLILNCALTEAGGAHLSGGAEGNYWTVDMGTR